jgi:hypothetical protein
MTNFEVAGRPFDPDSGSRRRFQFEMISGNFAFWSRALAHRGIEIHADCVHLIKGSRK